MGRSLPIFQEMQPLATKSSATIATPHHKVIMDILTVAFSDESVVPESTVTAPTVGPIVLYNHIIQVFVGDGVSTNYLSATTLWA